MIKEHKEICIGIKIDAKWWYWYTTTEENIDNFELWEVPFSKVFCRWNTGWIIKKDRDAKRTVTIKN